MNKMDKIMNDLTDPITMDLLDDPISAPCCGRAFSRQSLKTWLSTCHDNVCPCCKCSMNMFDIDNQPKLINIAYLVEQFKKGDPLDELIKDQDNEHKHKWSAHIIPLQDKHNKRLNIGELSLELEKSNFIIKPSLFIAVVDRSGSMSGAPWKQVETALLYITRMAHQNPMVKICIIAYDSTAQIYNPQGTQHDIEMMIKNMFTGGGTNFSSAFEKVKLVLNQFFCSEDKIDDEHNVSNVTVVFMTDGQDSTFYNKDINEASDKLVSNFKTVIQDCWKDSPISIHSVGFSQGCSKDFLEKLRLSGNSEGTFRFAEPSDDGDTLCSKLNSLFEVASKSSSVPIEIFAPKLALNDNINFLIDENGKGIYKKWITINNYDDIGNLVVNSSKDINCNVSVDIIEDNSIFNKWISKCIDDLASELFQFVSGKKEYSGQVLNLYLNLLEKKIDALVVSTNDDALISRLEFIQGQLINYRNGGNVNIGKLGDIRFSSMFREEKPTIKAQPVISVDKTPLKIDNSPADVETRIRYSRNNHNKNRNSLQRAICDVQSDFISNELESELQNCSLQDVLYKDSDENNAIHLAAYCGHSKVIKRLIDKFNSDIDLNLCNGDGETVVTLAIKKGGFHRTLNLLLNEGAAIPLNRKKGLERYAILEKYTLTADIISNYCDDDQISDINESMTEDYIRYVWKKVMDKNLPFDKQRFFKITLQKCMTDIVTGLLDKYNAEPTIEILCECTMPPKPDHVNSDKYLELSKLLIGKKPEIVNQTLNNGDSALSAAVLAGSLPHVKYFLGFENLIDQPNNLGNTPLWLACAKKYPCIITELINHGADINKQNLKGNPPLFNICQRGPLKIAEQFMSLGADLECKNENGDTLILLCCRNGQHDILKLFLNYVDQEFVDFKAHIDGFNAIFASIEQNRVECIKILHEYGINLEQKTDANNTILPNSTPLHLAVFYERTAATKTLLVLGANASSKGNHGQTPLHIAVIQGENSIIKLLLAYGADKMTKDDYGNTPIAYCRNKISIRQIMIDPMLDSLMSLAKNKFDNEEVKQALEILKSDKLSIPGVLTTIQIVNIVDETDGSSPLMQSIIYSNYNIAKVLVELGADPLVKNYMGLNSLFWANWIRNPRIKNLLSSVLVDQSVVEQLENLKKVTSIHCKQCLFLGKMPTDTENQNSSIDKRMEGSFNDMIIESTSANGSDSLENSVTELINYSGQCKFPVDNLIWNAKIHTIAVMANGEYILKTDEVFSLSIFTNNPYLSNVIQIDHPYSKCLLEGLNRLTAYEGEAYVGLNNLDRSKFMIGSEIKMNKIISASTMWRVAIEHLAQFTSGKNKKGTVILIKSKSGRYVAPYSSFKFDSEILFLPDTKFIVKAWYQGDTICLGQENIREQTFKIDDKSKYMDDKAMIIELNEI